MTTMLEPISREMFEPILKSINDLSIDMESHISEAGSEGDVGEPEEDASALSTWCLGGPDRIRQLLTENELDIAKLELEDVENQITNAGISENDALVKVLKDLRTTITNSSAVRDEIPQEQPATNGDT